MHEGMNHEREIEALLGGLRPVAPALGRDELMFRAGQQSVRTRLRSYQAATATLLVALIAAFGYPLATGSGHRPQPVFVEGNADPHASGLATLRRDEFRSGLAGYTPDQPPGDGSLASLRRAALTSGAEALPTPNYLAPRQTNVRSWRGLAG